MYFYNTTLNMGTILNKLYIRNIHLYDNDTYNADRLNMFYLIKFNVYF